MFFKSKRFMRAFPAVQLRLFLCTLVIISVGALTVAAHSLMQQNVATQADHRFSEITAAYVRQISQKLDGSSNLLYAMRGLFAAADVDAAAWERFIETQHSFERYPGMQIIGYADIVSPLEKPAYIAKLQHDLGAQTATIYPVKTQGDQVVLTYLREAKPAMPRRIKPYGFDLSSEPVRREALDQARATGRIAATAPVRLEPKDNVGFLLVLPLSDKRTAMEMSRQQPTGYAVTAFDVESFMGTVLDTRLNPYKSSITITDVSGPRPATLYTNITPSDGRKVRRTVTLQVANRAWRITVETPVSTLVAATGRWTPAGVLFGGIMSILLVGAFFYTLKLRRRLKRVITS